MYKKIIIFISVIIIAGISGFAIANDSIFFFSPHSQAHSTSPHSLSSGDSDSIVYPDVETGGMSTAAKIGIAVGSAALVIGGVAAAMLASGGGSKDADNVVPPNPDPVSTIGALTAQPVFLENPDTPYYLTLTNTGVNNSLVTVDSVQLKYGANINQAKQGGVISGVTVGTIPSNCQNLKAGESCEVPFTATQSAYGSDKVIIKYTTAGYERTELSDAAVGNTTISIMPKIAPSNSANSDNASDIVLNPDDSNNQIYEIQNTGNFTLHNLTVGDVVLNGVTYSKTCNGQPVNPGEGCDLTFKVDAATAEKGASTQISIAGNIDTHKVNIGIDGGVIVAEDTDSAAQHLQYTAIKVTNSMNQPATVNSWHLLYNGKQELIDCNKNLSQCNIPNIPNNYLCNPNGDTDLENHGDQCLIWIRAVNGIAPIGPMTESLQVNTSDFAKPTKTISIIYSRGLYVGGQFLGGIKRWDRTGWNSLGVGVGGSVNNAFAVDNNGDLIVGGLFSGAGGNTASNVAKWNGTNWVALGDGEQSAGLHGAVTSLAFDQTNHILYAGGTFRYAIKFGVYWGNLNYIAKWDGNSWDIVGTNEDHGFNNYVASLAFDETNHTLYTGGSFTASGGGIETLNHIAKWNGSVWSSLGNGLNDHVSNMVVGNNNTLYVGGTFTDPVSYIAEWNGNEDSWNGLGSGIDRNVFALTLDTINNRLFVSKNNDAAPYNILQWNGSVWSTPFYTELNAVPMAFAYDNKDQFLYVGGWSSLVESAVAGGGEGSPLVVCSLQMLPHNCFPTNFSGSVYGLTIIPSIQTVQ